jgi:hypothetical protein
MSPKTTLDNRGRQQHTTSRAFAVFPLRSAPLPGARVAPWPNLRTYPNMSTLLTATKFWVPTRGYWAFRRTT